jgi:hypothetical protein
VPLGHRTNGSAVRSLLQFKALKWRDEAGLRVFGW